MKIVFFGTPHFAAEVLKYLLDHHISVLAVVTQPDRPKGRSLQLTPPPVKTLLLEKAPHIPLLQPEKASQSLEELKKFQADLFVVVAYGQILSQKLLDIPPLGCINIHASLLPKYRGAAPIQRAILNGETETGIAIQKMVRELDAGDVICEAKVPIGPDMTAGELEVKLIEAANPLLLSVLKSGISSAKPQDPAKVTYAPKIELEEGQIDWAKPAQEIHNLVRAFSPRPGAWCWIEVAGERKRLKILRSQILSAPTEDSVPCGQGALKLVEVQPEGKKAMKGADWLRGQKNVSFIK